MLDRAAKKKVSVLYQLFWKYFACPEETEVSIERVSIDPDSRFHQLVWEVIVRDVGKH